MLLKITNTLAFCTYSYIVLIVSRLFPAGRRWSPEVTEQDKQAVRLKQALLRANSLALHSASRFGVDVPVGAVVFGGDSVFGEGIASDNRLRRKSLHAEVMAVLAVRPLIRGRDKTIVTNLEPCNACQDRLAKTPGIKTVAYGLPREEAVQLGIVREAKETIHERAERIGLPYEVVRIEDASLFQLGQKILSCVERDRDREVVNIDQQILHREVPQLPLGLPEFRLAFTG